MNTLKPAEFVEQSKGHVVLDIRTPAEFHDGHLPGAISFPLFSDEERVVVGKLYKQVGRDQAVLKGLEFVGPKMKDFVVRAAAFKGPLFLYCWRGGMRSNSMAWLLKTAGREVYLLEGGYKAYRTYGRSLLNDQLKLLMLSGPTGSGKTEILNEMTKIGHQVLDLEGLAHHKGSSFGGLGQLPQPGTESFTNKIFEKIIGFDLTRPIWLEGESQNIGKVFIPEELFALMNCCPMIRIDPPRSLRVNRLVRDYACFTKEELSDCVLRISKRLGGKDTKDSLDALEAGDYQTVVDITLDYYDKTYDFSMARRQTKMIPFVPTSWEPAIAAKELADLEAHFAAMAVPVDMHIPKSLTPKSPEGDLEPHARL